jgi:hypothetical protein
MNPRGQIHPQKALPRIVAVIIIIVGGMSDERGISTPEKIVLMIRVGSNFHKKLAGEVVREMP